MTNNYDDLDVEYSDLQKKFEQAVAKKNFKKIKDLLARMEIIDRKQGRMCVNNMMSRPELQLVVRS